MNINYDELYFALEESILLQSFYARLLNQNDKGLRHEFKSVEEWCARLREVTMNNQNLKSSTRPKHYLKMIVFILILLISSSVSAQELRKLDFVPLITAGTLDITSTVISKGKEQNPTINWIKHEPTMLTVGAGLEVALFASIYKLGGKNHPKVMRAIMWSATAIHMFAATNNMQQFKRNASYNSSNPRGY